MKTHVTETSREAYHSIDFSTLRGQVAIEIKRISDMGKVAYITLVAHNLRKQTSAISPRFEELAYGNSKDIDRENKVIKPFKANGKWFTMKYCGRQLMPVPDKVGVARRVDTWQIVHSEPPIEQPTLFSIAEDVVHGK